MALLKPPPRGRSEGEVSNFGIVKCAWESYELGVLELIAYALIRDIDYGAQKLHLVVNSSTSVNFETPMDICVVKNDIFRLPSHQLIQPDVQEVFLNQLQTGSQGTQILAGLTDKPR